MDNCIDVLCFMSHSPPMQYLARSCFVPVPRRFTRCVVELSCPSCIAGTVGCAGSSIREVHADAERIHRACETELLALRAAAAAAAGGTFWNTLGWERREVVSCASVDGTPESLAMVLAPPYGVGTAVVVDDTEHVFVRETSGVCVVDPCLFLSQEGGGGVAESIELENAYLRAVVSRATGQLTRRANAAKPCSILPVITCRCFRSLVDKRLVPPREVLSCPGNSFVLLDDVPFFWDAW